VRPETSALATHAKDLRSGKSVWADSGRAAIAQPLTRSLRADIVVVGAGVSGAFMAHALSQRFENIVVVDRRLPAHGSTMASTAMLQFEIDMPLTELSEKIGGAKAARAWKRSWRATQALAKLVEAENIRCGFRRQDSLYLAGDSLGSRGMEKEMRARHRIGLPGEFLAASRLREVFDIDRTAAIFTPGSSSADPTQLTIGLLRRAIRKGAVVYSPVEIRRLIAARHGVVLDTGDHFIEAKHCVFCTGYELLEGIPRKGTKITSSWAIASRPKARFPQWLKHTLVWEAADPYLYMRSTPDRRLVIGGEDEDIDLPSYRAGSLPHKTSRLLAKAKKLLPGLEFSLSKAWSGAFGESADGLPIIDYVPDWSNCITVMGFGGNGTIYSKIASEIVPTLLEGRRDKDCDLYRFR
jgi:glycine/D-amino acid oxidase-like deaminating enzyme